MTTPVTTFHDPGATNVFIPAATSQLQVEFSRNPATFPLVKYLQIIPGQAVSGLYPELSSTTPVTIVTQEDHLWADGTERPWGQRRPLRWRAWTTERRAYTYTLGNLTVDQAKFDVIAAHGRGEAARAMTDRTIDAKDVLTTSGNWPSANLFATVTALTGGAESWTVSGDADQFIKQGFNKMKQVIAQQTGGVVSPSMIQMVINPISADKMARTDELRTYMKNHESAMAVLRGDERRIVDDWGLPPILYGIAITVEDAVFQSTRRKADGTGTLGYVFPDDQAVFTSRIGGLVGVGAPEQQNAAPSFTTLTGFFHEELSVETEVDGWNRLTKGGITDNRDIVITAGNSGLLLQDITT